MGALFWKFGELSVAPRLRARDRSKTLTEEMLTMSERAIFAREVEQRPLLSTQQQQFMSVACISTMCAVTLGFSALPMCFSSLFFSSSLVALQLFGFFFFLVFIFGLSLSLFRCSHINSGGGSTSLSSWKGLTSEQHSYPLSHRHIRLRSRLRSRLDSRRNDAMFSPLNQSPDDNAGGAIST